MAPLANIIVRYLRIRLKKRIDLNPTLVLVLWLHAHSFQEHLHCLVLLAEVPVV